MSFFAWLVILIWLSVLTTGVIALARFTIYTDEDLSELWNRTVHTPQWWPRGTWRERKDEELRTLEPKADEDEKWFGEAERRVEEARLRQVAEKSLMQKAVDEKRPY